MTYHSIETVVAILGTIKSGQAYLPIDPEYPPDRIQYMLDDSASKILLTNIKDIKQISFKGEIIHLEEDALYTGDVTNPERINSSEDTAYIMYTSGSAGKPKGVIIEHVGLVNYIWWARAKYFKSEDVTIALYSFLAFDLTVTSIFTPLIGGNCILIYRDNGVAVKMRLN